MNKLSLWALISCFALLAVAGELLYNSKQNGLFRRTLDERFLWSPEEGISLMKSLTEEQRQAYSKNYGGLYLGGDLVVPFLYGAMFTLLLRNYKSPQWTFPIIAACCDYAENFCIMYMLSQNPDDLQKDDPYIKYCGVFFCPMKWTFLLGSVATLLNHLLLPDLAERRAAAKEALEHMEAKNK